MRNLQGLNAVITGASHGLGAAIARKFVDEGASVILCGRDEMALKEVAASLSSNITGKTQGVFFCRADVSSPTDVHDLFQFAVRKLSRVDVLVNNAGILGPLGPFEEADWDSWRETFAVNFMGAVSCCRAVIPGMKARKRGKIINISGGGVTKPLQGLSAYAASKAALVNFTATLAEEVSSYGIDVNAIAPGALATRMLQATLDAGPEKVGENYFEQTRSAWNKGGTPLEIPASLCAYLAGAESNGVSGRLIAALWDPWRDLAAHRAEIMGSDVYTMRRIIPRDRGMSWGEVE